MSVWRLSSWNLKVHCHAIQWFFVDFFCGRKWRRGDSRPRRRPTRSSPLPHFFSSPVSSFAINRRRDITTDQSVTLAKSFLSRTKMGFEIRSKKWKQKDKLAHENGENSWKPKQACGAPRIDLELSWSEDRSRLARLSGAVAYILLHSTMYTTISDRQDTCWARFAWKDARPPLFSPQQNGAKYHWIAWQCTFKVTLRAFVF